MGKRGEYMSELIKKELVDYITQETELAAGYLSLARLAPTPYEKNMLEEFSQSCFNRAKGFEKILNSSSGERIRSAVKLPETSVGYEQALCDAAVKESRAFKIYTGALRRLNDAGELSDTIFGARIDKGEHTLKILELLEN